MLTELEVTIDEEELNVELVEEVPADEELLVVTTVDEV